MIDIKNLNFKYENNVIFENFNLKIKKNKITSIIGPNGSGKSTLVKIILGLLDYSGSIKIDNELLLKGNINDIRKNIGVVMENIDNQFITETVMDEIAFTLENLNYSKKNIKNNVEKVTKLLNISDILKQDPHSLNDNQKQLVMLATALIHEPKILIIDNLNYLDPVVKDNILEILKDLKKQGMTIIFITQDIEDTLISDEIVVINKELVLQENKDKVYKEEKLLNSLGFKLPFMVELSNRLMFYDLIDHVIYDMKEMVDVLWK